MDQHALHPGILLTNRQLELILLPTEKCNFRCTYCNEDFIQGRMKPEVVEGVKRLLSRRAPDLDRLHISWFGGEPLLARGVIREVMGYVRALEKKHRQLHCTSDMSTNAWLLDRLALEELTGLEVRSYQVTLDGPKNQHDQRRLRVNGEGTYDQIWSNLKSIKRSDSRFAIQIRIHVDDETKDKIPELITQLEAEFGNDRRFTLFIRPVSRLGGPNDRELKLLKPEEKENTLERLRNHADSCGFAQSRPENLPQACYAARANSLVIRADGHVGKCTSALDCPDNMVGKLHPDGKLSLNDDLMLSWIRGVATGDPAALDCPLKNFPPPPATPEEAGRRVEAFSNDLRQRLSAV